MSTREQVIERCKYRIQVLESILKDLENGGSTSDACDRAYHEMPSSHLHEDIEGICTIFHESEEQDWVEWIDD